jgi:hypothetical protein
MRDISLSDDEALVLFEFLSRFSDTDRLDLVHKAEKIALWNLCCKFESLLVEPFAENYVRLLNEARERLAYEEPSPPEDETSGEG